MAKQIVVLSTEHALKTEQREQLLSVLEKYKKSDVEFMLLECGVRIEAVIESESKAA